MQTYKYHVAIGVGVETIEVPSLMCKWQFISQRYKIEFTYANVNFFLYFKKLLRDVFSISQTWLVPWCKFAYKQHHIP